MGRTDVQVDNQADGETARLGASGAGENSARQETECVLPGHGCCLDPCRTDAGRSGGRLRLQRSRRVAPGASVDRRLRVAAPARRRINGRRRAERRGRRTRRAECDGDPKGIHGDPFPAPAFGHRASAPDGKPVPFSNRHSQCDPHTHAISDSQRDVQSESPGDDNLVCRLASAFDAHADADAHSPAHSDANINRNRASGDLLGNFDSAGRGRHTAS